MQSSATEGSSLNSARCWSLKWQGNVLLNLHNIVVHLLCDLLSIVHGVSHLQVVILEKRNRNGTWPRDNIGSEEDSPTADLYDLTKLVQLVEDLEKQLVHPQNFGAQNGCSPSLNPFLTSDVGTPQATASPSGWFKEVKSSLLKRSLGRASVRVAHFRGQCVAAKFLHNIRLFIREMNMAAQARHPNLLQFIGATMDDTPIILTEFMLTSLRRILEQGVHL